MTLIRESEPNAATRVWTKTDVYSDMVSERIEMTIPPDSTYTVAVHSRYRQTSIEHAHARITLEPRDASRAQHVDFALRGLREMLFLHKGVILSWEIHQDLPENFEEA